MGDPSFISVSALRKSFGSTCIIDDVSLDIGKHEVLTIVGPSGCGKSTFLRILAGLDIQYQGRVLIGRSHPSECARDGQTGMLAQDAILLPWRTALANTLLPVDLQRSRTAVDVTNAKNLLLRLGLYQHMDSRPRQLSAGMRQRVSLAQLLLMRQELLLFDEPFSKLDEPLRWQLTGLMRSWLQGHTVVWVTHSVDEAVALGDRVGIWYRSPGCGGYKLHFERGLRQSKMRIEETGLPELAGLNDARHRVLSKQIELNAGSQALLSTSGYEGPQNKLA